MAPNRCETSIAVLCDPRSWRTAATGSVTPWRSSRAPRYHYRQVAALLEHLMRDGEPEPLVIGGHQDGIGQFFASLQPAVQEAFAGSFIVDTRALTPARVRDLAEPVIARWAEQRAGRLAAEILRRAG